MADLNEMTKDELMEEARRLDIEGRSTMDKDALLDAVTKATQDAADRETTENPPAVEDTPAQPEVEVTDPNPAPAPDPYAPTPGADAQPQVQDTPPTDGDPNPRDTDPGLRRMAEQTEAAGNPEPNLATERTVGPGTATAL